MRSTMSMSANYKRATVAPAPLHTLCDDITCERCFGTARASVSDGRPTNDWINDQIDFLSWEADRELDAAAKAKGTANEVSHWAAVAHLENKLEGLYEILRLRDETGSSL